MAAISEFDRLWETCVAKQFSNEMSQLLAVIETFEQRSSGSTTVVDECKSGVFERIDERLTEAEKAYTILRHKG
jgi:hypothetical protein